MPLQNFLKNVSSSSVKIGLDIGNFSVKIAQIKTPRFSKDKFLSFAVVPISGDRTDAKVIEAIKQAYKNLSADSRQINLSLCGPNIIVRYIILPQMNQKDLAKALSFELEKYVPHKKDSVISESHILANLPNNKSIVLLVVAEKDAIQQKVNLVKEAGLLPCSVNIDSLALSEAFKASLPGAKKTVALLDIGYRLSKLVVLEKDMPYFSRDIATGEFNIIQMISKGMDIDFDTAKQLEYDPQDKGPEITKIIKAELNSLIDEISLSFEYCERNLEIKVDSLFLTGGGARIKFLLESMERIPNLRVGFLNPTASFKVSSSLGAERLKEYSHLLGIAIGLAL